MMPTNRESARGAIAAGVTDITNLTTVDMTGFRSLTVMVSAAAIVAGAVTKLKMQASSDDGVADAYSDLEGTSVTIADTADNTMTILEIVNPQKKWLKAVITRLTQNAAFDSVLAIQSGAKILPVTQSTTHVTALERHLSPAEGTA